MPEDKDTAQVNVAEKEAVQSCAEFVSLSKARTEEYETQLKKMRNAIPLRT